MKRQRALCNNIVITKAAFSKSDLNLRKKLMKFYVWNINIYGAEACKLFGKIDQKYFEIFQVVCWRRLDKITCTDRVENGDVWN